MAVVDKNPPPLELMRPGIRSVERVQADPRGDDRPERSQGDRPAPGNDHVQRAD